MAGGKLLIYLLRRDLRVSDNPILHHLATSKDHGFTHLLPIFIFPSHQIEISGFLKDGQKSPYPQAVSQVGGFWRCGPHRAKFLAQSVWDLKKSLEEINSGLVLRVGSPGDVLKSIIPGLKEKFNVGSVWMTEEKSYEELQEEEAIASICSDNGVDFKLWADEKYFIDDRDTELEKPRDLPDVFTSYRKSQEPLRERPRPTFPRPKASALPAFPDPSAIPAQGDPFVAAESLDDLESRLVAPLGNILKKPPKVPDDAISAHPFRGGESVVIARLTHLIKTGALTDYKDTRNGLVGEDFSTKFSAFLALGCISARKIHEEMLHFEDGSDAEYKGAKGYGKGQNEGTKGVRFELLWRDYMRLCLKKFGPKLFDLGGFRQEQNYEKKWKSANKKRAAIDQRPPPEKIAKNLQRFLDGTTGMGLIDASQRELYHTGYTSNRARQNVASFLAKHLEIDWRYGAEWYEMLLVDYDVSSNWANWQYVAGVGNDPRGDARIFNPVKQAFDYDKNGDYVRNWVLETRGLEKSENLFQPCTASQADLEKHGLENNIMVTDPLKRIEFSVDRKPKGSRASFSRRRGGRGGGRGGRGGGGHNGNGGHHGGSDGGHGSPGSGGGDSHGGGARLNNGYRNGTNGTNGVNGSPNHGGSQHMHMNQANYAHQSFPQTFYPQQGYGDNAWFNNFNQRGRSNGYQGQRGGWGYNTNRGGYYGGHQYPNFAGPPMVPAMGPGYYAHPTYM